MNDRELIAEAKKARWRAYTPYSKYKVGAALLAKSGKIYHGCNIENAAYSPTNCAERTAFFKAIYDGEREFEKIAIVGGKEDSDSVDMCPPCGVCRQIMMEFCNPETFEIIMMDGIDGIIAMKLEELLPHGFGPGNLK